MDYDYTMAKHVPKQWQCPFNVWVKCLEKNKCEKCGWNPEVESKRLKEMLHGVKQ